MIGLLIGFIIGCIFCIFIVFTLAMCRMAALNDEDIEREDRYFKEHNL